MAVDITNYSVAPLNNPNMIEIVRRSDIITGLRLKERISQDADILISRMFLGFTGLNGRFDDLIKCGQDAANKALESVKNSRLEEGHIYYDLFTSIR